jgi:uncharacterized protein (TIGR03118 family)
MRMSAPFKTALLAAGVVAALGFAVQKSEAGYIQTNLVSDLSGLAVITDPVLHNPWGISHSATSPFWVSDQGTNLTTLYVVNSAGVSKNTTLPQVSIPPTASGPQGPTGQVTNIGGSNFSISGGPARFIFADLNGTIYAWNQSLGTTAAPAVSTPNAVYTGLAISSGKDRLYAANTAAGTIDVFNGSFAPVSLGTGAFQNPFPGLVPFNVQQIGGKIYVTYAVSGRPNMQAATEGSGAVAVFNKDGTLLQTLQGGKLASPWGLTLAPSAFGQFGGDLLVGNFSFATSEINAFDPLTLAYEGTIPIDPGAGNTSGGLWALTFGNGGSGGNPNVLYFSDGINGEKDGLFASISVPEPSSLLSLIAALSLLSIGYGIARRGA